MKSPITIKLVPLGMFSKSKEIDRGWRDGSEVESTGCSSRGPEFNSQHPHGSSQLSVTPGPGDLPSSHRQQAKHQCIENKDKRPGGGGAGQWWCTPLPTLAACTTQKAREDPGLGVHWSTYTWKICVSICVMAHA